MLHNVSRFELSCAIIFNIDIHTSKQSKRKLTDITKANDWIFNVIGAGYWYISTNTNRKNVARNQPNLCCFILNVIKIIFTKYAFNFTISWVKWMCLCLVAWLNCDYLSHLKDIEPCVKNVSSVETLQTKITLHSVKGIVEW